MNKRREKGITLIALIITIIVMLILVAVVVRVAVTSGLFGHAQEATNSWSEAQRQEGEIGNGKVNINGKEYNSIDEYLNSNEKEKIPTTYTVVHEYYTNGAKEGSISSDISNVYVGDTVNEDSIERITSYLNNTYEFTSINSNFLTLSENSSENIITLRYDRTVVDPVDPNPDPVEIPDEPVPLNS